MDYFYVDGVYEEPPVYGPPLTKPRTFVNSTEIALLAAFAWDRYFNRFDRVGLGA